MGEKRKCVIVEDEQHNMRLLESYISNIDQLNLVGSFVSPVQLLNFEGLEDVQIMYLDIQMPGMTGIEFLKSVPVNAEIIFTTAYPQYALEGFELNVTDYLLKPIEFSRFVQATNKAFENIKLKSVLTQRNEEDNHIILKVDKKLMKFSFKDIVYVQSDWNYVHVVTRTDKYVVLSTMKNIEKNLTNKKFVRVHQSYIINLDFFDFIEGNQVSVNGHLISISRKYKEALLNAIHEH